MTSPNEPQPGAMLAGMTPSHARESGHTLAKWQLVLIAAGVTIVALILAAYAAAGSYDSLWHLAATHGVPLPRLNPIGLDGGLVGVILLSIGLTWAGHPLGWLRFAARLFAAGTLAANGAAGWPDPVAVFLRAFAPLLLVIITEAVHSVLLSRRAEARDPIPLARWLLAPWPTFRLWRRMVLWRVHSYAEAVEMELSRLRAIQALTAYYRGRDWRKTAPQDLVWMLRRGVKMPEALAAVAELTAPAKAELPGGSGPRKPARNKTRKQRTVPARKPVTVPAPEVEAEVTADTGDLTTEMRALAILDKEPGISGSELGRRLGKTDRHGRELIKKLAHADTPAGSLNGHP